MPEMTKARYEDRCYYNKQELSSFTSGNKAKLTFRFGLLLHKDRVINSLEAKQTNLFCFYKSVLFLDHSSP